MRRVKISVQFDDELLSMIFHVDSNEEINSIVGRLILQRLACTHSFEHIITHTETGNGDFNVRVHVEEIPEG